MTKHDKIINFYEDASDLLDEIGSLLKPGAKLTLIARRDGSPEQDILLTEDDLDEIIFLVKRRCAKGAEIGSVKIENPVMTTRDPILEAAGEALYRRRCGGAPTHLWRSPSFWGVDWDEFVAQATTVLVAATAKLKEIETAVDAGTGKTTSTERTAL